MSMLNLNKYHVHPLCSDFLPFKSKLDSVWSCVHFSLRSCECTIMKMKKEAFHRLSSIMKF